MVCRDNICAFDQESDDVVTPLRFVDPCLAFGESATIPKETPPSVPDLFLDPYCTTIEHKDSLSTVPPGNIDPDKVFAEQLNTIAALEDLVLLENESCASSISSMDTSGNGDGTGMGMVQVIFDLGQDPRTKPKKGVIDPPLVISATTSLDGLRNMIPPADEGNHDDAATVSVNKSGKSTRFNDDLNKTREYAPPSNHNLRKYQRTTRRDIEDGLVEYNDDYPDHRSEAGKARPWSTSSELLDLHRFNCRALGTSANDESAKPHVLTAAMMDAFQDHLPFTKRGEQFWLKYSLVRDGSSMQTLLHQSKGSDYTVVAIETMDGEVFGAFTARPWDINYKYYGSHESFLWRLSGPRGVCGASTRSERVLIESELEVFPFAGHNQMIQICTSTRLAVGGGTPNDRDNDSAKRQKRLAELRLQDWGFGLAFGTDLQEGTSSPCYTFDSPSLSQVHSDGSVFEVTNLEIWTLTPCTNIEDAERMSEGLQVLTRCPTI